MMENAQIADIFDEIADLLELEDANQFRVRSYRNAARSVRNLPTRVEEMAEHGDNLCEIPNVGEHTAWKIHEILQTGHCRQLDTLHEHMPSGLTDLLRVPGIGPRKAMQLHRELDVDTLADLEGACREHRVHELRGMGDKTEQKILEGIDTVQETSGRMLLNEASDHLDSLTAYLDSVAALNRWEVAGSFRRGKETIGDLDIVLQADRRDQATEAILRYENIEEVLNRGDERVSVRLAGGLQVDFRYFEPSAFGAAWLYFTGSKAHNIRMRRLAQQRDWKLNEYGLFKGDNRLAGATEKSIYHRLGLSWIPPELREDRGEVEVAREGSVPRLIRVGDVHGDLHCHTSATDGVDSIEAMAKAAREAGFEYLAITDHSRRVTPANGLDDDQARRHADAIREVDAELDGIWLLAGIEVDILKSGALDLREETLADLDWVVASVHYDRAMSRKAMTDRLVAAIRSGVVHCIGHPLGRILGRRDPAPVDLDRIIEACLDHDVRLEINCQPDRLDLPDTYCRDARRAGVGFTLGTDSHSATGFHCLRYGVATARRGWLRKRDVLNTRTADGLRKVLRKS